MLHLVSTHAHIISYAAWLGITCYPYFRTVGFLRKWIRWPVGFNMFLYKEQNTYLTFTEFEAISPLYWWANIFTNSTTPPYFNLLYHYFQRTFLDSNHHYISDDCRFHCDCCRRLLTRLMHIFQFHKCVYEHLAVTITTFTVAHKLWVVHRDTFRLHKIFQNLLHRFLHYFLFFNSCRCLFKVDILIS